MTLAELKEKIKSLNEHIVEVKTQSLLKFLGAETDEASFVREILIGFDKNIYDPWPNDEKNPDFDQKLQDNIIALISNFYQQEKDHSYKMNVTLYEVKKSTY